jgi:hypothetical protein
MGQMVSVVQRPSSRPGLIRFEANRNLSGSGHERFTSVDGAVGDRPAAVLARKLLSTGKVESVHIYGNVITVDVAKGYSSDGLDDVVRTMYQYWKPGMTLPTFDDVPAESGGADPAAADAGGGGGATGVEAAYLAKVPAVLVERSRAALAKWRAANG